MAWYCISFGLIARYDTVMYRCYSAPANYRVVHLVIFIQCCLLLQGGLLIPILGNTATKKDMIIFHLDYTALRQKENKSFDLCAVPSCDTSTIPFKLIFRNVTPKKNSL